MIRRTNARSGMTLVEMLVAAAMSIMVMWLLTWCYQQGLGSFSTTKSQGDLMDQLRQTSSLMTRDLTAQHFVFSDTPPTYGMLPTNGGVRLSDLGPGGGSSNSNYTPPAGYFVAQSSAGNIEGYDGDGLASSYSTSHWVQFTVILPGGPPQNLFSAELAPATNPPTPTTYFGRAAEVSYFLAPNGTTSGGTQLYNLYRRQRVCGMTSDDAQSYNLAGIPPPIPPQTQPDTAEVMSLPTTPPPPTQSWPVLYMSQMSVNNRMPYTTPLAVTSSRYGEDVLMSNVVSMEIKFTGPQTSTTTGAVWPLQYLNSTTGAIQNFDYPYDNLPGNGLFDTAGVSNVPSMSPIRITGAMIRIRAYSPRTQQTRQTTFAVSL